MPRLLPDVRAGQSQFHCSMSRSHRSGPVWKTPRNSGLCTATARPAMTTRSTVRTGEMLPCSGNNLRRRCSRTHRHASPHHRVTPFLWSLSLDMSQRRNKQMTDDQSMSDLARYVYQASIVSTASTRCWPKLETYMSTTANRQDNCGLNYSFHTPTTSGQCVQYQNGVNKRAASFTSRVYGSCREPSGLD